MERGEASSARVDAVIAFLAAAFAVVVLALRGGTYDIVDRQEVGLLVWWVLALGLALGLLPRSRPHRVVFVPIVALALLGIWTALSLDWTASDERTLAEVARVATYAGLLLLVVLAVDRSNWRAAAAGLVAGALVVASLATLSRLAPSIFPDDPVRQVASGRLNYPFDYWNAVGAWGAMAVSGGLAWSAAATRTLYRAAFLAALPAAGLSIYLSYSRASIGGLALGAALAVALSHARLVALAHAVAAGAACAALIALLRAYPEIARGEGTEGAAVTAAAIVLAGIAVGAVALVTRRPRAEHRWALPSGAGRAVAAAAAVALVAVVASVGPDAWESFKETDVAVPADPAERLSNLHGQRYPVWSAALDGFAERPWKGAGAGTFEFVLNRDGRSPVFVRDAHSIYIEPLPELGWPGAALTLAFLAATVLVTVGAFQRARRARSRGAAAASLAVLGVWLVQAGVDWMWEMTAVSTLALAGAAVAWARLGTRGPSRPLALRARLAAAAGCLLACALMVPGIASTSSVRKSQAAVRDRDFPVAAERADDAVSVAPWGATPLLQRALVAEAAGRPRAARADLRRAAAREPWNWRPPLLLARVERDLGRPGAALREFRRARRLRPRAVVFEALGRR